MRDFEGRPIEVSKWIEDNDRGDEDSSERPQWTVVLKVTTVDVRPLRSATFTYKVTV